MRFTLRNNGEREATVQITHYLTRARVATILCYERATLARFEDEDGQGESPSAREIENAVRDHLYFYGGDRAQYWTDNVHGDEQREIEDWADQLVRRHWPQPREV